MHVASRGRHVTPAPLQLRRSLAGLGRLLNLDFPHLVLGLARQRHAHLEYGSRAPRTEIAVYMLSAIPNLRPLRNRNTGARRPWAVVARLTAFWERVAATSGGINLPPSGNFPRRPMPPPPPASHAPGPRNPLPDAFPHANLRPNLRRQRQDERVSEAQDAVGHRAELRAGPSGTVQPHHDQPDVPSCGRCRDFGRGLA